MIVLSRAEKRTILDALKAQLNRLSKDKESHKDTPLVFLVNINAEISRLNNLIKTLSEVER